MRRSGHWSSTALALAGIGLFACAVPAEDDLRTGTHAIQARAMVPLTSAGTTTLLAGQSSATSGGDSFSMELRPSPELDEKIPKSGLSASRVPADHVPAPAPSSFASNNPGWLGFNGISHRDQRLAGAGNQFSLEPPDQ